MKVKLTPSGTWLFHLLFFAAPIFCSSAISRAQPAYTVTDLGTLGGFYSASGGVNNSGDVAGYSYFISTTGFEVRPFRYRNGTMTDLGTLGGSHGRAQRDQRVG